MKRLALLLSVCLIPCLSLALERKDVDVLLAATVNTQSNAYLEARAKVLALGTNALPFLAEAAVATNLNWQQHLAARICYEHIARKDDIEAFRRYDWRQHPQFDKSWERNMIGARAYMGAVVVPRATELGFWYYYIEMLWKNTRELSISPFDRRINADWREWCTKAVIEQSEGYYAIRAMIELLESDAALAEARGLDSYLILRDRKEGDAVPVLVRRHQWLFDTEIQGQEVFPGQHNKTHVQRFSVIISFADSRHVELIAKYIDDHPALALLKEKLAEVKARPAPPPKPEPPFRLGLKLVELK